MKFTRITGCTGIDKNLILSHDYGELPVSPEKIDYAFAMKIRNRDGDESPTLLLSIAGEEGFFYIDGRRITHRLFQFEGGDSSPAVTSLSSSRTTDLIEKKFKWVAGEICARLSSSAASYIDRPLLESVESSIFFLPSFSSRREAAGYCLSIMSDHSREGKKEKQDLLVSDEELKKITAPSTERAEWSEGTVLEGKYTVQEVIRGGMGTVYIVFDSESIKFYAMKTFQERYLWDEKVIRQFIKEAEIWINLENHPNIVKAELVKIIEGKPYIFLEYVRGDVLDRLMEKELLPVKKSIELAIQFCEGMSYAFRKLGLIHRDIKPSNCFLTRDGILKITDFGLGKIFDEAPEGGEIISIVRKSRGRKSSSTSASMVGTIPFMAPELFKDLKKSGVKSDIYSFGIVFYMMLTGINPYSSEDTKTTIDHHLYLEPEPPEYFNSEVPPLLSSLVLRCLSKNPEARFQCFQEIQAELQGIYNVTYGVSYQIEDTRDTFSEEDWVNKGISLASLGRYKEAIITFEQALSIDPESLNALIQKGISLLKLGEIEEAFGCFEHGVRIAPESWEGLYYYGEASWKLGKREEALTSFEMALGFSPSRPEILGSKGRILSEMGKLKQALNCFDEALKINPKLEEIWDAKGVTHLLLYQFEDGSNCFLRSIEINPRYHPAWSHRGEALQKLGFYQEAIKAYQTALSLNPDSLLERIGIGTCFKELGNTMRALLAFDQALKLRHNIPEVYMAKANLLDEMSLTEDAVQCLREGAQDTRSVVMLTRLYWKLGYYEKGLKLCNDLVQEGNSNEEICELKDSLEFFTNEKDALLSKIMLHNPVSRESVHRNLSSLLSVFCNIDDAISYLVNIITMKEEPHTLLLLAQLQKIRGDLNESISNAQKALNGSVDLPEARAFIENAQKESGQGKGKKQRRGILSSFLRKEENAATALDDWMLLPAGLEEMQRGAHSNALNYFQEAIQRDPESHACLFFAALALKNLGDLEKGENLFQSFIEKFPESPGYYRYRILTSPVDRSHSSMEELYQKWVGFFPVDPHSWLSYLRYLINNNRRESALILGTAISGIFSNYWLLSKRTPLYWNLRGEIELFLGRPNRAFRFFSRGLKLNPSDPVSLLGIGKCHDRRGNNGEALLIYEKLEGREDSKLAGLYETANSYLKRRKQKEALESIERALQSKPDSILLSYKKAQIYVEFDDYKSFFDYYSTIHHPDILFSSLYLLRARSLINTGMLNEASSYLKGALSTEQDNIPILKSLGYINLWANNPERALPYFYRAIGLHHLCRESCLGKAIACYLLSHYEQALTFLREHRRLSPLDVTTLLFLGATYFQSGEHEISERHFLKALELNNNNATVWSNLGIFFSRSGRFGEALQYVERALRISKESVFAWLCRGKSQKELRNLDEAYRSIEQALFYAPQNINGWLLRGIIEFELGDYKESLVSFIKACEVVDKNPLIWYNRGASALYTDELYEAGKSFTRSIALDQQNPNAWLGRAVLGSIQKDRAALEEALGNLERCDPSSSRRWKEDIETYPDPRMLLPICEVLPLPFDLPIPYPVDIFEPLDPLRCEALDKNF